MAENKIEYIKVRTPKGVFNWVFIGRPDPKYGNYTISLFLNPADPTHKEFIEKLQKMNKELFDQEIQKITKGKSDYRMKKFPVPFEDKDGKLTGEFYIKASSKKPPLVCDTKGKAIENPTDILKIWSGSKGKLALSLKPNVNTKDKVIGYTVYLSGVQVIDARLGAAGTSMFQSEEGTFSSSEDSEESFGDSGDTKEDDKRNF